MPVALWAKILTQSPAADLTPLLVAADNYDEEGVPHHLRAVVATWEAMTRYAAATGFEHLYAAPVGRFTADRVSRRYNRLHRDTHPLHPLFRLTEAFLTYAVALAPDSHPLGKILRRINAPHTPREIRSRCRAHQLVAAGLWEGSRPTLHCPWLYDTTLVVARQGAAAWHAVLPFDRETLVAEVNRPRDGWTGESAPRTGRPLPKAAAVEAALDRLLLPSDVKLRPVVVVVMPDNASRTNRHRRPL